MNGAGEGQHLLERRLRELECLNSLVREIARADSAGLDTILELITRKVTATVEVDESSIRLLTDDEDPALVTIVRNVAGAGVAGDFMLDLTVTGWILREKAPLVASDLLDDPRFPALHGRPLVVRSLIAAPMMLHGKVHGILSATRRQPGPFDDAQVALVATIATQSAELIEEARLRMRAAEVERLKAELSVARRIQGALLPRALPHIPGYTMAARTEPASEVGGDYYDAFALSGERIACVVSDVTGKGVPAAILASAVQATLRAELRVGAAGGAGLTELIPRANRAIADITSAPMYATVFLAVLEPASGELSYVRAGHVAALHIETAPDGETAPARVTPLMMGGPPLGLVPDATYQTGRIELGPGDCLVLFSDGLSEAFDEKDAAFGDTELSALAGEMATQSADAMTEGLLAGALRFAGNAPQADDMTVLVLKREKGPARHWAGPFTC